MIMKKIRELEVNFDLSSWAYGVDIKQIKDDIYELEKLGATDIYIGGEHVEIIATCLRLETDDEFKDRIDRENKIQERIKQRELRKLEELKLKYEK